MVAYTLIHFRPLLFVDCYWLFFLFLSAIENKLIFSLNKFAYSK